ncbi:COP1-interacting protein 7 [Orobanche minor]
MESRTLLDYAVFRLTPTRTRCDLVIFAGEKKEKIASGLLEPFVTHLKSAKDRISKGGYSITLQPASSDSSSSSSSWFTKATLERFVRFVSTPEVLERFVTIEREINQIESSIESNELIDGGVEEGTANGDPKTPVAPSKSEGQSSDTEAEEKPKVRLQRVLESRKAMLKKEQAMAYARALVAGFEMDYLYGLVSFADAFGAQRLREACINFMELCKKKNDDKIWMDEVAAMQASYMGTSGIILAGESNDLSESGLLKSSACEPHTTMEIREGAENGLPMEVSKQQTQGGAQLPTWPHHFAQYIQNSQAAPIFQPYPGFIFQGMQVGPSHYPGNMPWPANFHDSSMPPDRDIRDGRRHNRSHKKKEKQANIENEKSIETDPSSSSSNSSEERMNNNKHHRISSRKVVVRNINYITSNRSENNDDPGGFSSNEDEHTEADSLFGSLKRHHKSNSDKSKIRDGNDLDAENKKEDGNWDIFQNLLMTESRTNSTDTGSKSVHIQEEHSSQKAYRDESMSSLDKKSKPASDDFFSTERSTGNEIETDFKFEVGENSHGVVKRRSQDEELLFPQSAAEGQYHLQKAPFSTEPSILKTGSKSGVWANPSGNNTDHNIFSGDQDFANKKDVLLDDSFMVQSRTPDGPPHTQPKDDILMVTDIVGTNNMPRNFLASNNFYEPQDLKMMLGHNSVATMQGVASWSSEMDYRNDVLKVEAVGTRIKAESGDGVDAKQFNNGKAIKLGASKELGRKVSGKESKSKAPSGSLRRSKSDVPSRSKISTPGSTVIRSKSEKEEEKRKRMEELLTHRQKRIVERSVAKGTVNSETINKSSKESKRNSSTSTKAKLEQPTDENNKSHRPVMKISTINRLAAARTTNKPLPTEPKVGQNKKTTPLANSVTPTSSSKKTKGTQDRKKDKVNPLDKKNSANNSKRDCSSIQASKKSGKTQVDNGVIEVSWSVKDLHTVTSSEKRNANTLVSVSRDDSVAQNSIQVSKDDGNDQVRITVNPMEGIDSKSIMLNADEKSGDIRKKLSFSPVVNISTPPETDEANQESIHSRKKWNNGESSPKIPKGFRRLLLFGRKT